MSLYDAIFDLIINDGHSDLDFMVQRFCFISERVFLGWTSFFVMMSQCDAMIDITINAGHSDLHCTVQWFCLIMLF